MDDIDRRKEILANQTKDERFQTVFDKVVDDVMYNLKMQEKQSIEATIGILERLEKEVPLNPLFRQGLTHATVVLKNKVKDLG